MRKVHEIYLLHGMLRTLKYCKDSLISFYDIGKENRWWGLLRDKMGLKNS